MRKSPGGVKVTEYKLLHAYGYWFINKYYKERGIGMSRCIYYDADLRTAKAVLMDLQMRSAINKLHA